MVSITFKGLPGPVICDYLSREDSRKNYDGGTEFQIGRIEMVSNTGTYIDCPFHRYADGKDLSETALERFVDLPAIVVRVPHRERIEVTRIATSFGGRARQSRARPHRLERALEHASYFENHSVPYCARRPSFLRDRGRRAGRHRLAQHRRHAHPQQPAGALDPAARGDPHRRAPARARAAALEGILSAPCRRSSKASERFPYGLTHHSTSDIFFTNLE